MVLVNETKMSGNRLTVSEVLGIVHPSPGGVVKLVITLACQAGDRGFKSRRSRNGPAIQRGFFLEMVDYKIVRFFIGL